MCVSKMSYFYHIMGDIHPTIIKWVPIDIPLLKILKVIYFAKGNTS